MQPYFYPYAGYFRLLAAADEFVLYDCVQFPRTGRVHRSEIDRGPEGPRWLTLPLARQRREVRIADLEFAAGARATFDERLRASGLEQAATGPAANAVLEHLRGPLASVTDFLEAGLALVARRLGLDTPVVRSSRLGLAEALRGQDRILAICRARGATAYVNAPGGRELYSPASFKREGVTLHFLDPYEGRWRYLLPALLSCEPASIAGDVLRTTTVDGVSFLR